MAHKLAASVFVAAALFGADAFAGDCSTGGDAGDGLLSSYPRVYGVPEIEGVPANVFFLGYEGATPGIQWIDEVGNGIELVPDPDVSEAISFIWQEPAPYVAYRPESPLVPGTRYTLAECEEPNCAAFTVGEEDTTPPEQAVVSGIAVNFGNGANDGSGFSCPDWDQMTFNIQGSDERTADQDLLALAYFAPTAELVPMQTAPELVFRPTPLAAGSVSELRQVRVELGLSWRRQRDGLHFRKSQDYCFSIALMDRAGNVGPLSEPECISTTDVDAPYVNHDAGGCAVPSGHRPVSPLALALCAVGLVGVARRRRALM